MTDEKRNVVQPERSGREYYETPLPLIQSATQEFSRNDTFRDAPDKKDYPIGMCDIIIDFGAGDGRIGKEFIKIFPNRKPTGFFVEPVIPTRVNLEPANQPLLDKFGLKKDDNILTDGVDIWFNCTLDEFCNKHFPLNGIYNRIGIVSNPPFHSSLAFLKQALTIMEAAYNSSFIMFLLPLTTLCTNRSYIIFKSNPVTAIYNAVQRPSFTGDKKTFATEYAWFEFKKGYNNAGRINWLSWR